MIIREDLKNTDFYQKPPPQFQAEASGMIFIVIVTLISTTMMLVPVFISANNLPSSAYGILIPMFAVFVFLLFNIHDTKVDFDVYELKVEQKLRGLSRKEYRIKEKDVVYYTSGRVYFSVSKNQTYLFLGKGNKLYHAISIITPKNKL